MTVEQSPGLSEAATAQPADQPSTEWLLAVDALHAVKKATRSETRAQKLLEDALKAGALRATAKAFVSDYDGYPVPPTIPVKDSPVSNLRIAKGNEAIVLGRRFFAGQKSQYNPLPLEWEQSIFHVVEEPAGVLKSSAGSVMALAPKRFIAYEVMLSVSDIISIIEQNTSASSKELKAPTLSSQPRKDALRLKPSQWSEALSSIIKLASKGDLENAFGRIERGVKAEIEREIIKLVEERHGSGPSEATAKRKATWLLNMNAAAKMARSRLASSSSEPA